MPPSAPLPRLSFQTVPGRVYELRLLLQRSHRDSPARGLSDSQVTLDFRDSNGTALGPELACEQPQIPGWAPALVETLPARKLTDALAAGGLASRFVIAPPDATRLEITLQTPDVTCHRAELLPVGLLWSSQDAQRARREQQEADQRRRQLLERHLPHSKAAAPILERLTNLPLQQIDTLIERFAPRGDWTPVLDSLDAPDEDQDYRTRMQRLRAQAKDLPRVAFIGSERGHERLSAMAEVFWLREASHAEQLTMLRPDLILIETTPGSGAGAEDSDWPLAFSSLDGRLPERGAALLELARAQDIPVHLWVTAAPASAKLWRGCAAAVTRIIAEDPEADWSDLGRQPHMVPRATEPTACSLASQVPARTDLMLVPTGSDILKFPELATLLSRSTMFQPLITEFRFRFTRQNLDDRINGRYQHTIRDHTRAHQRRLLQAARMVLLPAASQRSHVEQETMALDAIASGAIPVIYGQLTSDSALLNSLPICNSPVELMELQGLLAIRWCFEREWRRLMLRVMRHHCWQGDDRKALLGRDPFPEGFDSPRISTILVTNRPQLLQQCFETFRKQSWPNKELVLVLNMDTLPEDLPELRPNEHIFALPTATNIGECLNRGIAHASGRYWAKMDDDDYYTSTYLEETVYYYRSTQADVVGRHSPLFFFSANDSTRFRPNPMKRTFCCISTETGGHISGATLSAIRHADVPGFSCMDRNSADSNWVKRIKEEGCRMFGADMTSIVVFRDADDSKHTWSIQANQDLFDSFRFLHSGHLSKLLETNAENHPPFWRPPVN